MISTVLSSSGWQKYYAATNNTVWNPIPLNNDLFGWYAIPGTFNAWPSTSQAVVISALNWNQYVGIAVLSNIGIPNSVPVNVPNTVERLILNGRGSYAGILNDGFLSTTDGEDQLIGVSYGIGSVNGLGGSGGTGILNKQFAIINTRGGNDRIAGGATGTGGIGILNIGQILTENGNDIVFGIALGNGTRCGIENRNGLIDTGSGDDQISGTGNNAIGGIVNSQGSILSGDGNDFIIGLVTIIGQVTSNSGRATFGVFNGSNGIINSGSGSDTIFGTATGLMSVGIANFNNSSIDSGIGSVTDIDTITGTATGDRSVGIGNQGGTINVNAGLTPGSIILTGNADGNNSVGIRNSLYFGAISGIIATGNDADIITGNATGNYSAGIVNDGFYTDPNSTNFVFAKITNMNDKMGQIIGTASGTNSTGIVNNGWIDMRNTASSDGVVIQGTGDGVESRGIMNGYNIYTGSGNDVITGQTIGGSFGILNLGRIDTGAGNDTVTSIGDFGGIRFLASDGLFLGMGNDTLSGFGNNGYFDGGADIDELFLPVLNGGQFYTITKDIGSSATIQRSSELGSSNVMYIENFETLTALGSDFTSSPNNFAGLPSSFTISYL